MATIQEISLAIKNEALRMGFDACGFSKADFLEDDSGRLKEWLNHGWHAGMNYMEGHCEKRSDPRLLVEGAKSVISLLLNYYTEKIQSDPKAPVISKYAYGKDYHLVFKDNMKVLYAWIDQHFGPVNGRFFVDSAPVMDRVWARKAGLGWIGKNSNLINRKLGSFFFIGEIILDLELDYNKVPENDYCGTCTNCIDACPTDAILENRTIDSNRCISYHTIENRDEIPDIFTGKFKNRVFGCDICQDVCPWNRKVPVHGTKEFDPPLSLLKMSKADWYEMTENDFEEIFRNSPVKRTGYTGLKRNLEFLKKDR